MFEEGHPITLKSFLLNIFSILNSSSHRLVSKHFNFIEHLPWRCCRLSMSFLNGGVDHWIQDPGWDLINKLALILPMGQTLFSLLDWTVLATYTSILCNSITWSDELLPDKKLLLVSLMVHQFTRQATGNWLASSILVFTPMYLGQCTLTKQQDYGHWL